MKVFFSLLLLNFTLSCVHIPNIFKNPWPSKHQIRDIVFWPLNSLSFRLSEIKDKKAFVIVLREYGKDKSCSISEKYGNRLKLMEEEYSKKDVQFIYLYVGQTNPHEMAKADLRKFGFKGPYVVDLKQKIMNILSAQTTGEVFILTPNRQVIYKGPLNTSPKKTSTDKNHYVKEISDDLLKGRKIKSKKLSAPGCIITRPTLTEKIVYWKDVAPIIKNNCTVCHNPKGTGPMDFVRYEDIAGRGSMFEYVIKNDLMPPSYVADNLELEFEGSLEMKEKAMLLKWAKTGFQKKRSFQDKALWVKKKPRKWKPDYVIHLPEKVVLPKEGFLYRRFLIDPKFKEDKWIKYIEFQMKPKLVHHAKLFIMKPGFKEKQKMPFYKYYVSEIGFLRRSNKGKEVSEKIPAQHKLYIQIHYEAQGREMIDDYSHIKIEFYKKTPSYQMTRLKAQVKDGTLIPPNASNYHIKKTIPVKKALNSVQGIYTHMHLRGKRVSLFLIDPQGNRKRIFGLDPWSVLFEQSYRLKKTIHIPENSTLEYHWWYDNSSDNISNPNPNKEVLFGTHKIEEAEMGAINLYYVTPTTPHR